MMRSSFVTFATCLAVALLGGCGKSYPPAPNLPPPVISAAVGPDDLLEVHIVGEKELPVEYRVTSDGAIDLPYAGRIEVAGLSPQEISTRVGDALVERKYLTTAQVTVGVKQYNSKVVEVVGQVTKPGPQPFKKGLSVVGAISAAGWFTPLADSNHVHLIRRNGDKTVSATISVDAITDNAHPDFLLQPGDTLKVDQRIF